MFLFRLALALGCTVAELNERMTAKELTEWQAYYQLEPWGTWRDNWHFAQFMKLFHDANRGSGSQAAKLSDFMFEDAETTAIRNARMLKAKLDLMAGQNNG